MQKRDLFLEASGCVAPEAEYSPVPQRGTRVPLKYPQPWGRPTALPSMATEPDRRLRRKAGEKELPVYVGGMDDSKDAEYESDSESSESSAAISVASSEEERLREEQCAAADVSSPSFPT